jgi:serine/threonine protein kinase
MQKAYCTLLQESRSIYHLSNNPLIPLKVISQGPPDMDDSESGEPTTMKNERLLNFNKKTSSDSQRMILKPKRELPNEIQEKVTSFSHVLHSSHFLKDEKLARTYFKQLMSEIETLHNKGIYGLNLTSENLVLTESYKLQLHNKKRAEMVKDDQSFVMNSSYLAPELKNNSSDVSTFSDIYALGILLFVFKTGAVPYNRAEYLQSFNLDFLLHEDPETFWIIYSNLNLNLHSFSQEFKELFIGMVRKVSEKRLTLSDIKKSKWYQLPTYSSEELQIITEEILF